MAIAAYPRGRQTKLRQVWEATYGTSPGSGWSELNAYTHDLTRTRALEADDILGAGFANNVDARPAAPNVEDAAGKLSVPGDLEQIGFWLAAAFGRAGAPTGSGPYTHTFVSGANPLTSFSLERELVAAAQYDGANGFVVKSLKLPFKPGKGYMMADVDLAGAHVLDPYTSTAAGTPTVVNLANRVANFVGTLSIGGTQVGLAMDASATFTNDLTLDRYIQNSAYVAAAVREGMDIAVDVTARYNTDALVANGVVDPNYLPAAQAVVLTWAPTGSAYSLALTLPAVRFEPVGKPVNNGKTITIALKGRAEVGASAAMATAVLVSPRSTQY